MTQVTLKLVGKTDMGWRYRALMASALWIGWLPDFILDRLAAWAARGIRIHVGVEQVK